jgi:hypothetical protein
MSQRLLAYGTVYPDVNSEYSYCTSWPGGESASNLLALDQEARCFWARVVAYCQDQAAKRFASYQGECRN